MEQEDGWQQIEPLAEGEREVVRRPGERRDEIANPAATMSGPKRLSGRRAQAKRPQSRYETVSQFERSAMTSGSPRWAPTAGFRSAAVKEKAAAAQAARMRSWRGRSVAAAPGRRPAPRRAMLRRRRPCCPPFCPRIHPRRYSLLPRSSNPRSPGRVFAGDARGHHRTARSLQRATARPRPRPAPRFHPDRVGRACPSNRRLRQSRLGRVSRPRRARRRGARRVDRAPGAVLLQARGALRVEAARARSPGRPPRTAARGQLHPRGDRDGGHRPRRRRRRRAHAAWK